MLFPDNFRVLVSILNWNAPESTIKTVTSVLLSDYIDFSIILVDNNSTDSSVHRLRSTFPEIEIKVIRRNLGFAGAHKVVAEKAIRDGYELLWILNNDVEVFENTLSELVNTYKKYKNAVIGSMSLQSDGLTVNSGGGHNMLDPMTVDEMSGYNIYKGKKITEIEIKERPVSGIQGSSMLIPVDIIKKYGFMDTRFFLYGEETEYSYRLREKYGIQTILAASSKVIHHGGGSFKKNKRLNWVRTYYSTRNDILVHRKYSRSFNNEESSLKRIPSYIFYFLRHFLVTPKQKKDFFYWDNYYRKLGLWHALLKLRGKYLKPEDFIE